MRPVRSSRKALSPLTALDLGVRLTRSQAYRTGITVLWFVLIGVFFRFWEITIKAPSLLVWSFIFVIFFSGTAGFVHGRAILDRRHPVSQRIGLWLALILVALIGFAVVPEVAIQGTPVRTVAFAGVLDIVFPGWILISALVLLWKGWHRWVAIAAVPVSLFAGLWIFVVRMPGSSYTGPLDPLTSEQLVRRDALETHVRRLSSEIGERHEGRYDALEDAARYIDSVLTASGYDVRVDTFETGGRRFRNLQVHKLGQRQGEEIVVVGAHYDTAEGAPGADDNASGTAGVLELARLFASERPTRTVRFVLFTNEEPPFFATEWMGSRVYAKRAAQAEEVIVAMLSLETIGYYSDEAGSQRYPPPFSFFYPDRGDFIGFVGNLGSGRLVRSALAVFRSQARFPSQGAAAPSGMPGVSWSDHASFWYHGYQAIMISDTAPFRNPYYHTEFDTADKLDFDRMTRVVDGIAAVVRRLASED